MTTILPRRAGYICQSCRKVTIPKSVQQQRFTSQAAVPTQRTIPYSPQKDKPRNIQELKSSVIAGRHGRASPAADIQQPARKPPGNAPGAQAQPQNIDPIQQLKNFKSFVAHVQSTDAAADHDDVLDQLMDMFEFSNVLVHGTNNPPEEASTPSDNNRSEGDLLDDLAEEKSPSSSTSAPTLSLSFRTTAASTLSQLSYDLLRSPKVYITSDMLQIYVRLVCQLGTSEYLPEIFHLYATKPVPRAKSANPVKYSSPWPKMPKYAVPIDLAEAALESAILKKNLSLALAVIDTTVGAPAFRTNKLLRQASIPTAIVGATPIVAYAGADWVSHWQNTMDPDIAKYTAVAGGLAYIGTLTTIGFVALTTYNDQMQRVVWRPGTYLSSRWLKEEERRFFDRLALAWGFQDKARWGEEHGGEWLRLRDEAGLRDMILDKTDLMEGMQ